MRNAFLITLVMFLIGCSGSQNLTLSSTVSTASTNSMVNTRPSPTIEPSATLKPTPAPCADAWLVFTSHLDSLQNDSRDGIYKTCADGSSRQQIVSTSTGIPLLAWPDGTKFVYIDNHTQPQFLDVEGHNVGVLNIGSNEESVARLTVSPNEEYIFYISLSANYPGAQIRFKVVNLSTGTVSKDLAPLNFYQKIGMNASGIIPKWSPDGNHIVWVLPESLYISDIACDDNIHTCKLENIREISIAPNVVGNSNFAWSPDGTRLAMPCTLSHKANEEPRLCIFDLKGALIESFGKTETGVGVFYNPSWSPDGSKLAFSDGRNLYVLYLSDKKVINLTSDYGTIDDLPVWIP